MKGVQGNQAAQVRMFAHDAVEIKPKQIDTSASDGGFSFDNVGTNYAIASDVATTASPSSGRSGLTVDITAVNAGGAIKSFNLKSLGTGYEVGDVITITGGDANASFTITKIGIKNTSDRGVCLYIGIKMASITVTMESGNPATFKNIQAGSFLPVLATNLTAATRDDAATLADNDIIALY
jgi:hypothetical protein